MPIVPGTLEPLELAATAQAVTAEAADGLARLGEEVGFPLLVKATAGGGGRGMRRVDAPAELMDAAAAAGREAAAAFGDGSIYLERYVERARHVEVQLIGDDHGTLVALGERDCSIQRRHQKLVEEAPAPGLTRQQRERLHELARAVAGAVGVRNAVTAEFLLSPTGDFWFLEVNARLQVEHGVTELVSGVDIVVEQLRVAAGARLSADVLSAAGRAAEPERHAIEVRLSAEDPAHGFAPAAGTLTSWREPTGAGLRVDSGVEQGSRVSAYYDPLLAKVLAVAPDRASAIARLAAALDEMLIGGLQTTLPFHRWLLELPEFTGGDGLSTDLVSRLWRPEQIVAGAARRAAELAAADYLAVPTASSEPATAADPPAERWWRAGLADAFERRA